MHSTCSALSVRALSATAIVAVAGMGASAGTPMFSNTLGVPGLTGSYAVAFTAHDDGSGEKLYVTGQFTVPGVTGTENIASWNGSSWESVGGGLLGGYSNALTSFQGDLIAAGYFNSANGVEGTEKLARWDGTEWNSMGAESATFLNSMWDLQVWDDGTGEKLYVAGNYVDIGGLGGPDHLATWDGTSYAPLGDPIGGAVPLIVLDLQVADLGDGEKLYAGGRFLNIDGVPANNIAVWDGTSWEALGDGVTRPSGFAQVLTMTQFDDGSGPALYVGGRFETAGGVSVNHVAKWDGSTWSALDRGLGIDVQELVVFDDGTGEALYGLGSFDNANSGIDGVAKWTGTAWEQVGSGTSDRVFGGYVYDAGEGEALHLAGGFTVAGGMPANYVASILSTEAGCNGADNAEPYGVLDLSDIQGFVTAFTAQTDAADLAAPFGVYDLADVQAFVTAFTGGCP